MTWGELEQRTDALAAALPPTSADGDRPDRAAGPQPPRLRRVAGRHRQARRRPGAAQHRVLRTAAGRAARPRARRRADLRPGVRRGAGRPVGWPDGPVHVIAWEDEPADGLTVDGLIADHLGQRPPPPTSSPHVVLLTSGTTGAPKGARRGTGGGRRRPRRLIERVPWRAEDTLGRGGADVPRLGVRLPGARRHDGQHRGDAPALRPRADPRDGRPAPRRRDRPSSRSCSSGSSRCRRS